MNSMHEVTVSVETVKSWGLSNEDAILSLFPDGLQATEATLSVLRSNDIDPTEVLFCLLNNVNSVETFIRETLDIRHSTLLPFLYRKDVLLFQAEELEFVDFTSTLMAERDLIMLESHAEVATYAWRSALRNNDTEAEVIYNALKDVLSCIVDDLTALRDEADNPFTLKQAIDNTRACTISIVGLSGQSAERAKQEGDDDEERLYALAIETVQEKMLN